MALITLIVVNLGLILLTLNLAHRIEEAAQPESKTPTLTTIPRQDGLRPDDYTPHPCYRFTITKGIDNPEDNPYFRTDLENRNLLTAASTTESCRVLHFLFNAVEQHAIAFQRKAKRYQDWYRYTQVILVILGVTGTGFVAVGNRVPWFAPYAILPTAAISIVTGVSYVYDFQGQFLRTTEGRAALQQLEGQILLDANLAIDCESDPQGSRSESPESPIVDTRQSPGTDNPDSRSPGTRCEKIDVAKVKVWDERLTEILNRSLSEFLEGERDKNTSPGA